jgi:NADH:ubiquinone oxidoreductase subunit C
LNVRNLAKAMNALNARFVTITAYQLPAGEGFRLEYHWDFDGQMLGFPYRLSGNSIESIYDLCEAADWIEREVHEGFAVDFLGRDYEPLLLRPGDKLGVNLREEVVR